MEYKEGNKTSQVNQGQEIMKLMMTLRYDIVMR